MLCVFAIAAAICIRAFVWSDRKSEYNENLGLAAITVQSAAENMKSTCGSLEKTGDSLGCAYSVDGDSLTAELEGYSLSIRLCDGSEFVGRAEITATDDSGSELIRTTVCWQKGGA